ncbi:MAG: hypothetical protein V5B34_15100 [Accumulibacter sp.]|jgi:hypothetical protein
MHVELLKPHTHAGVDHAPGAVIELDDELARWLIDLETARPVGANPTPALLPPAEQSQ